MGNIQDYTHQIKEYLTERDWFKYNNPKDTTLAMMIETAEVLEHVQWRTPEEAREYVQKNKEAFGDEIADVFIYLLQICIASDIDLSEAFERKLEKVKKKYPAKDVFGEHKNKYG